MAGMQRIVITDEETVKRLNLMAAMTGTAATDLATQASNDLWEEKKEGILSAVGQMSPLAGHLEPAQASNEETPVTVESGEEEETRSDK